MMSPSASRGMPGADCVLYVRQEIGGEGIQ